MFWNIFIKYILVFAVGGTLCAIAQILIDRTKLTSARILVIYVISGVILTALGIYPKLVEIGHSGATIPITGFGYTLCKGVYKAVDEMGFKGIFTGGLGGVAIGIAMAIFFGLVASIVSKPKGKEN
jgi:stage V sporulation protein AE